MILGLSLVLASGCTPTPEQPVKYFKEANLQGVPDNYIGEVKVSVFVDDIDTPPSKTVSVADLSEKPLSELIKAYGEDNILDEHTLKKMHEEFFAQPVKKSSPKPKKADHSLLHMSKRVKLFVANLNMFPANRVLEMNIKFAAQTKDLAGSFHDVAELKIDKIEKIKPLKKQIDEGSTQQTNTIKGSASLSLAPPIPGISGASLSQEQSQSIVGKRNLKFEVPYINPFWNDQEGQLNMKAPFPAIEISGWYEFDIYFKFPYPNEVQTNASEINENLTFTIDKGNDGSQEIEGTQSLVSYPLFPANIYLKIDADYIFRQVFDGDKTTTKGMNTIDESDDEVELIFGEADQLDPLIFEVCDQVLGMYRVLLKVGNDPFQPLQWQTVKYANRVLPVEIRSPQNSVAFRDWMEKSGGQTGTKDGGYFFIESSPGNRVPVSSLTWSEVRVVAQHYFVNIPSGASC